MTDFLYKAVKSQACYCWKNLLNSFKDEVVHSESKGSEYELPSHGVKQNEIVELQPQLQLRLVEGGTYVFITESIMLRILPIVDVHYLSAEY